MATSNFRPFYDLAVIATNRCDMRQPHNDGPWNVELWMRDPNSDGIWSIVRLYEVPTIAEARHTQFELYRLKLLHPRVLSGWLCLLNDAHPGCAS